MGLVRPAPVEYEIIRLQSLQVGYPRYYEFVVQVTRNIFILLGFDGSVEGYPNKIEELSTVIREVIEIPFEARFICVVRAFDNPRNFGKRKAYCLIGGGIDARQVDIFEFEQALDHVKQWCYDEVMQLATEVRFTLRQPM